MAEHLAVIAWRRAGPDFATGGYSREHTWTFDGGLTVPASPAPSVVAAPWSNPAGIDPEEAFVAAIASCHMLTFLWLASRAGWVVDRYDDRAVGMMTRNERGIPWVNAVTLYPQVVFGGDRQPGAGAETELHHEAHQQCVIANSVRTAITVATLSGAHG